MFKKHIDYLSPRISLFYEGNKRHNSNVGSILTIIMIIFSGIYSFYLLYNITEHNVSNFMFYKNYLNDAGLYYFNDTGGIFHFFQLYDYKNQRYGYYNNKYVRIFMSRSLYKDTKQKPLSEVEHWVYDNCRDGIDNKNIQKNLFQNINFADGACLRYYFNDAQKKYYPIEDSDNFKYPYLIHGSGRNDNLFLETVVEKCDNNSILNEILGPCGDEKEFEIYYEIHKAIYFQLLENQVNTDNYSNSIYQYLFSISGSLDPINVPVNNVNFMPFIIEIKKGIVIPRIEKIVTYIFDDNRKTTYENSNDKNYLAIFDYWLVNSCQIIKGGYNNIYDILPNIGGIIQLIYYIFYSLNYLHNKFIILQDCNKLFFKIYNKDYYEKEDSYKRKKFINFVKSIREEIQKKRKNFQLKRKAKNNKINDPKNNNINIRNIKIIKTDIHSNKNIIKTINKNKNDLINDSNIFSNSNDLIMDMPKNHIFPSSKNINVIRNKLINLNENKNKDGINQKNKKDFLYYQFSYQIQEFIFHKNNEMKFEPLNQNVISQFITFFNYFLSSIGNKNANRIFFILNKFRQKILGEENLFRSKIILYHLEKYFNIREIEKIDILELYNI